MPELPEVETIVRTLAPALAGHRIRAVHLHRADIVSPADADLVALLGGRAIAAVRRRGKRIVFELDNGGRFYIHLGMTGRLTLHAPKSGEDVRPPHTHLQIILKHTTVRFQDPRRFGGLFWLGAGPDDAGLGPEPLTLPAAARGRRLARTTRAIKSALLDQSLVAGLGNIYVDEALFASRVHPLIPANTLDAAAVGRVTRAIKRVLRAAIAHRGSTLRDYRDADGANGYFQNRHQVYGRDGQPCRVCATPVAKIIVGGRGTHYCPACQRRAARA